MHMGRVAGVLQAALADEARRVDLLRPVGVIAVDPEGSVAADVAATQASLNAA
jgi:hypothetical protein